MKQKSLVSKVYEACVSHNLEALAKLRKKEFAKIIKRKQKSKAFTGKWIIAQL
jgi:hypothetical protein